MGDNAKSCAALVLSAVPVRVIMRWLKGSTARQANPQLGRTGQPWGRDRSIAEIKDGAYAALLDAGFNGAAIDRSRKSAGFSPESIRASCFNGAAIDRSRKCSRRRLGGPDLLASMGPRS